MNRTVKKTKRNTIYDTDGNEIYHDTYGGKLSDTLFSASYDKKSLRNAVLKPTILRHIDPKGVLDLQESWMVSSRFSGVTLHNANFSGANLGMTKFTNCYLDNVNFSGADLTGARFKSVRGDKNNFEKSIMNFVHMKYNSMYYTYAKDAIITNSDLRRFHIEKSDFSNVNFEHTMVDRATFKYGKLTNADFSKAFFDQLIVTGSDITGTKFPKGYEVYENIYGRTIVFSPNFDRSKSLIDL